MKVVEIEPDFDNNLWFQWYNRRDFVVSLVGEIEKASDVDELEYVAHCDKPNTHFTFNRFCKVYFEILGRGEVALVNFALGYNKVDV